MQQRGLHRERHVLRQAARLGLVGRVVDAGQQRVGEAVERGVRAARRRELVRQRRRPRRLPLRSARSRSSAMMLPAPSQIELSGISR